jgi:hypothetical protein
MIISLYLYSLKSIFIISNEILVQFSYIEKLFIGHILSVYANLESTEINRKMPKYHGRRFSPGTPASSTTKTGRHDIAEILLKVTARTHAVLVIGLYELLGNPTT